MTTYANFATQVRRELEEGTASVWADESILGWTNEAADEVATRTKCYQDEVASNTVVAQQSYDLPDYTLEPRAVFVDGIQMRRDDFRKWSSLTASGAPCFFTWANGTLYLRPIPNVAASMRVFRYRTPTPAASTAATTAMPFQSRFDSTIKEYVKAKAYQQIGDTDMYRVCKDGYEQGIQAGIAQQVIEQNVGLDNGPVEVY